MPPVIDKEKCTKCGQCVDVCPSDVFFGSKKREVPRITYPEECNHESACVLSCPIKGAIRLRIPLGMMVVHK